MLNSGGNRSLTTYLVSIERCSDDVYRPDRQYFSAVVKTNGFHAQIDREETVPQTQHCCSPLPQASESSA